MKNRNKIFALALVGLSSFAAHAGAPEMENIELQLSMIQKGYEACQYLDSIGCTCTADDLRYVRDHADDLRKELEYAIEHQTQAEMDALCKSFERMMTATITMLQNPQIAQLTTYRARFQHPMMQSALQELRNFWSVTKQMGASWYPAQQCPCLHRLTTKMWSVMEQAMTSVHQELTTATEITAYKPLSAQEAQAMQDMVQAITTCMRTQTSFTLSHKALNKTYVAALINVMKDKEISEQFLASFKQSQQPLALLRLAEAVRNTMILTQEYQYPVIEQFKMIAENWNTQLNNTLQKDIVQLMTKVITAQTVLQKRVLEN